MRAQRKAFWWTLMLSVILFAIMAIVFFLYPANSITAIEFIKVVLSGVSTGLVVSAVMAFVNHSNEKNQYMQRLFSTANAYYYSLQKAKHEIIWAMDSYSTNPQKMTDTGNLLVTIFSTASKDVTEAKLFENGYFPLCGTKNLRYKKERMIAETARCLGTTRDFLQQFYTIIVTSGKAADADDNLFYSFYNYKRQLNISIQQIDAYMHNLETVHKFDISWDRAKAIANESVSQSAENDSEANYQNILNHIGGKKNMANVMSQITNAIVNPDVRSQITEFGNSMLSNQQPEETGKLDGKEVSPCPSPNPTTKTP